MNTVVGYIIEIIILWMALEILNYFYYIYLFRKTSKKVYHPQHNNSKIPLEYYKSSHFFNNIEYYFCHTSGRQIEISELHRNNIKKMILYLSYGKTLSSITDDEEDEIEKVIDDFEKINNIKIKRGINKNIYCMRAGSVGLDTYPRPLIMYVLLRIIRYYVEFLMYWRNYKKIDINGFVFFYPKRMDKNKKNIIINHGYGLGCYPYLELIDKYAEYYNVIAANYPNISNLYFHDYFVDSPNDLFPCADMIRETYLSLLDYLEIEKTDVFGHSAGSLICAILDGSELMCERIDKRILIEPVSFFYNIARVFNMANTVLKNNGTFVHGFLFWDIHNQYFQAKWSGWSELLDIDRDFNKKARFNYDIVLLNKDDHFIDCDLTVKEYSFCIDKLITIENMDHGNIILGDLKIFDEILEHLKKIHND